MAPRKPSKKLIAGVALVAAALLALLGGFLWQALPLPEEIDPPVPPREQEFRVVVDEAPNWETKDLVLAMDDTVVRFVNVRNEGTASARRVYLYATVDTVPGLDRSVKLSQAMTLAISYKGRVLLEPTPLARVAGVRLVLPAGGLAPGASVPLKFSYRLTPGPLAAAAVAAGPRYDFQANPTNRLQGASLAVTYAVRSTG